MMACSTCLELDGAVNTDVIETMIALPSPRPAYSGMVCKRCLSLGRTTRVTCRIFRPILPDKTSSEGRSAD